MERICNKKVIMILLLAVVLVITYSITFNTEDVANAEDTVTFASGTGTEADPYIIETKAQLNAVRNNLSACYKLNADIEFTDADFAENGDFYNDGKGWVPIGSYSAVFTGNFDGNGYVIKNLKSNRSDESCVGLFGYSKGTITQVGLVDTDIVGSNDAAAICGRNGGKISECYATGSVKVDYDAGAVAGWNDGIVTNCYSCGAISGKRVGGIIGYNGYYYESENAVSNCYSVATLIGFTRGGIIGYGTNEETKLDNSYSAGYCKDIVGSLAEECEENYNGSVESIENLKKKETYVGFDFEDVWTIDPDADYWLPTLRSVTNYAVALQENTTDYSGGYGTNDSPYLIKTTQQLSNIRKNLGASYKLENDIVFEKSEFTKKGAFYNEGKRWEPIGTKEEPFSGTLDGNGHIISGLIIDRPEENCAAMFLYNSGGIYNLGISGFRVEASSCASAITVYNNGTLRKCFNNSEDNRFVGIGTGLFCIENSGLISECYNTGNLNICGAFAVFADENNTYAVIEKCYNSGNISSDGDYSAAGIVGANYGTVTNCYNSGNIIASGFVGGITRVSYGNISGWDYKGIISNCYNIGTIITKTNSYSEDAMKMRTAGGIIGNCRTTNITNCYTLDTNYNYNDDSTYGKICSIGKMTTKSTYKGFDFDNIWEFNENGAYKFPTLKTLENYAVAPTENTMDFEGGYGTKSSPYVIKTKAQLNNIRKNLTACYRLDADISFSASDFAERGAFYNDGKGWEPIGNSSNMFAGTLDGNSHTISGLVIDRPNEANIGLFGYSCGNVIDLNMSSCKIEGETKVGCIAGYNYTGKIIGCNVAGEVVAYVESDEHYNNYTYAGGVAGYSEDGNIDGCKNSATVKAGNFDSQAYAGGIAGFNGAEWYSWTSIISNCHNDGVIEDLTMDDSTGSVDIAGIVGKNAGKVLRCYNTGSVQGINNEDASSGGISGDSCHGIIMYSYNLGDITSKRSAGGILAHNSESSQIKYCYNAGKIEVTPEGEYNEFSRAYAGGIVGNAGSLDEMDCCYNAGSIIANYGTVGGLIGKSDVDDLKVNSCYNVGYIDCTTGDIGGIAGECESTFTDCFYLSSDKVKKGIGTGTDQGTSCTSAELQNVETYGETFDFDYDEIWAISDTADYKYPILTEVVNPELQYTLSAETRNGVAETPTAKTYGNGKITINATSGQMYVCLTQGKSMSVIPSYSTEWKKATSSTLTFDGLEEGSTYEIYTYVPANGSQKASYISQALVITLLQPGDPTGDGNINAMDALYLKRALAGWNGYAINFSACDVNCDSTIDDADIMCLERHVADWEGYETLPVTTKVAG